jgi:Pvc16 N-terminal domain
MKAPISYSSMTKEDSAVSHLTIATITALVKGLLENGLVSKNVSGQIGGDAAVTALPPDRINIGAEEKPQLNLFLYQITPSVGLRTGFDRPGFDRNGAERLPTMSLELHYLITAYGAQDYHTELLLGHALETMLENSVLSAATMKKTIASFGGKGRSGQPVVAAIAGSDLADQIQELRITPQFLSAEDLSKFWSALQAKYRPSLTYKITGVPLFSSAAAGKREKVTP